jgi:hypothetical protein
MNTAKLQINPEKTKPMLRLVKNDLQLFYQGFNHYWTMSLEEGYIIFKLPSCNLVEGAMRDAEKRIEAMNLNLTPEKTGKFSPTFIVREKGGSE